MKTYQIHLSFTNLTRHIFCENAVNNFSKENESNSFLPALIKSAQLEK